MPGDFTSTTAGNRHCSTGTMEGHLPNQRRSIRQVLPSKFALTVKYTPTYSGIKTVPNPFLRHCPSPSTSPCQLSSSVFGGSSGLAAGCHPAQTTFSWVFFSPVAESTSARVGKPTWKPTNSGVASPTINSRLRASSLFRDPGRQSLY